MKHRFVLIGLILIVILTACSPTNNSAPAGLANTGNQAESRTFTISAIPDQDPEKLQRLYGGLADYLTQKLGVPVEYKPVIDYTAAVTAFKVGDLDMVWFGGLTGVQARLQVPGAQAILQRDIDSQFHSVFIANKASGLTPFEDVSGLTSLKGHTFTFGSESSTSGRLMPQYYLKQAGVGLTDFKGEPGFSGSHDKTIQLVESGTYEAGVLNEQVWKSRTEAGEVDMNKVVLLWRTPAYFDYHWVIRPDVSQHYGADFLDKVKAAFMDLDPNVPEQKQILDLFGAQKFVATQNSNYDQIEEVGRELGKIQ
jgi:phosphonate transport system substrate-binding protein